MELFNTVLKSFLNRAPGSKVSGYAIIILIGSMLWMLDHYSVISRVDTYFTTGNMTRIAETKHIYKDNPAAQKALDQMLDNELNRKSVSKYYLGIFSKYPKRNNGLSPLCNTLTTIGLFPVIMLPLAFLTMLRDYIKGATPLVVELLTLLTVCSIIALSVWILQWLTSQFPPILENSIGNIVLNILIQILFFYFFFKYMHISAKVRANH